MNTFAASTLGRVAEVILGRQRSPQHDNGPHMVPYLRAANVKDGTLDLSDVKSMNFSPSEQTTFALRSGDVLVTEGSGSLGTVGASAVWNAEIPGTVCFQNTLLRLRPRSCVDDRFLAWWARSAFASGQFASVAGGANIYHLSAERVRALPLSLPPLDEQRRIADFLDAETARIDRLIAHRERQVALLDDLIQSDLSAESDALLAAHGHVRVRHVLRKIEQGWSPQCEDRQAGEGEWGVVKAGCVNGGTFHERQHKALPNGIEPRLEFRLKPGDLLMSRASGSVDLIGSLAVVPDITTRLLLCDKVYRLTLDRSQMRERFVARMLRTRPVREHIKLGISGAEGMANNISVGVVKDCVLPKAPLSVQDEVVNRLERHQHDTDSLKHAAESQMSVLTERKQALVTAAVTGQIDVTSA